MTLPEDVAGAIEALIAHCPSDLQTYVETIRAHLLGQDAEIAQLDRKSNHLLIAANEYQDRADLAESRLAAADALLVECRRLAAHFFKTAKPGDLYERIDAHLQGAGDDDLSMLPADVQEAVSVADRWAGTYEHGFSAKNDWNTIRAELLRLDRENAELHKSALGGYEDGWHALRNERDALRTELAKLKARIAESVVATLLHGNGDLLVAISAENPADWAGKAVRLLVEDEG